MTTVAHVTTPVPSLHAAKSISERKLSAAIPLATLRVTMETSSTASNDYQPADEDSTRVSEDSTKINDEDMNHVESITPNESDDAEEISEKIEETTSVEQRLKKITEEIEKYSTNDDADNHARQSFFSITDFINRVRPSDKKIIPQIDSDYSNTMHLGEKASIVSVDDSRRIKTIDLRQTNRALY